MPALDDVAFECPCCRGPLLAEAAWAGLSFECPHCFEPTQVPSAHSVNKEVFKEPQGLRRVLQQVRDREWEVLRRKLKATRQQVMELEMKLQTIPEQESLPTVAEETATELDSLRTELAAMHGRLAEANQALAAAQSEHKEAVDAIWAELNAARGEVHALREQLAEEKRRVEAATASQNDALIAELQQQIAELRSSNGSLRAAHAETFQELSAMKERAAIEISVPLAMKPALDGLENSLRDVLTIIAEAKTGQLSR